VERVKEKWSAPYIPPRLKMFLFGVYHAKTGGTLKVQLVASKYQTSFIKRFQFVKDFPISNF